MQKTKTTLYNNIDKVQTEKTLSQSNCATSFQNMLRTGDLSHGHIETRMCYPIKVNKKHQRPDQISHIFTGEDPKTIKETGKKHYIYNNNNRSKILFNDYYFERHPIFTQKKIGYMVEQKIKENNKHPYSDEYFISPRRKELLQKKLVSHNPLKEYSKQENEIYNKQLLSKNMKKAKNHEKAYGSQSCSRILGGNKSAKNIFNESVANKINCNDFNINKSCIIINRNDRHEIPYYAKRHYRHVSCGRGQGLSYC